MSEPTPETQPKLLRQTCLACRQSKVKCDRASPACGRCVRLGIACIDSAPSRRGRGRSVGKKTAALQQLSGSALDSVKSGPDHTTRDIQDAATRGGAVSIEHVREWLLVALARDSSTLFARASLMASQGKLKLSDVFAVPTANGACCAARSECCAFHERLPPGNPFSRRFAAPAPVTPQLSPEHSPPPPASVELDPPAAKRARAGPVPGAPARAIRTDTRALGRRGRPASSSTRRRRVLRRELRRHRRRCGKAPREGVARREPLVEGAALGSRREARAVRGGHGEDLRELELSLGRHERGPREERRAVSRQCDEEPLAHVLDRDGAAAGCRILYISRGVVRTALHGVEGAARELLERGRLLADRAAAAAPRRRRVDAGDAEADAAAARRRGAVAFHLGLPAREAGLAQ